MGPFLRITFVNIGYISVTHKCFCRESKENPPPFEKEKALHCGILDLWVGNFEYKMQFKLLN